MSRGLDYQRMEFPFARGLNQKADPRLLQAPELARAVDVEFDDVGGLRLRKPYASIGANIHGGGTISNCRRIYAYGSELVLFTDSALYSWSSQLSAWVLRGTHLAVKVDEQTVFATSGDQVHCDRAELNGVVAYAWSDGGAASISTGQVYYALVDKSTGAVLVAPTAVTSGTAFPRLVATTTKILLFYITATPTLLVRSIDPTTLALSNATTVLGANFGTYYDAVKTAGADSATFVARRNPTTSYEVGKVTAGLSVSQSTKNLTCDSTGIAVATEADTPAIMVVRGDSTAIQADVVNLTTLADIDPDINVGSTTGPGAAGTMTAGFRADGRCYAFWDDEVSSGVFNVKLNYVTVGSTTGAQAIFVRRVRLASRVFSFGSSAYVHVQFQEASVFTSPSSLFDAIAAQLQNTAFLYRDDQFLAAKVASGRIGAALAGYLPSVTLTSGTTAFSWCATERRRVPIGTAAGGLGYADRGPRDVTVTFDSNDARRVARLGETLYIACGEGLLQFDGVQLVEVGFHQAPWVATSNVNAAGNNTTNGTYAYRFSDRWDNANGERDRSTTGCSGSIDMAAPNKSVDLTDMVPLFITHKTSRPIAREIWRTSVDPTDEAPFYLVTSSDPTATAGSNRYLANDTTIANFTTFNDDFTNATLTTKEINPENFGVLENLPPPASTLIVANDSRIFLAGIANEPHMVVYSKLRSVGDVAAFNDALTVLVPEPGGDITGLAFLHETLVVFRENAIYALDGQGFDNTGGGANYQSRLVVADVGAVGQESIVLTPAGIVFKSNKGWYLLNRGWTTQYIGGPVADYDGDTVYAATIVEAQHQIRIVTSARILVYDYLADAWAEWSVSNGLHATMWNGTYHYLATSTVNAEQASYAAAAYGWDVEMLVHLGGIQGFSRVRKVLALGEVRGSGSVRVRIGTYAEGTYFDDKTWTISPTTPGTELNFSHMPAQQQHKAVRVRLTSHTTAGEKPKLSAIALEVGLKHSTFRHLPAAQRQ